MFRSWQNVRRLARLSVAVPSSADQPFLLRFGRVTCYAFAIASVALALLVTQGVRPLHQQPPVLLFFVAVILTSWYAGRAAGFMASILSMLALDFFFVSPTYSLRMELVEDGSDFVAFAAATWLVTTLQHRWRQSHHKLVAMERDMETARQIQQRMFPSGPPALAGFEVGGACFPAAATGGDFFDYIPMPNGCIGIVCGDVSGHGIGPALLMALVHSYLRALARTHVDPAEILTKANRLVHDDMEDDRFITLFFARLDPSTRALVYAGAGHEAHLIDACGKVTTLSSTGLPLGILEEGEIGQGPSIILEHEQILLLLSDGILETRSAGGEQFGLARVLETVKVHRQKPVQEIAEAIYQAARDYAGNVAQDDDMTIVIVRVR